MRLNTLYKVEKVGYNILQGHFQKSTNNHVSIHAYTNNEVGRSIHESS